MNGRFAHMAGIALSLAAAVTQPSIGLISEADLKNDQARKVVDEHLAKLHARGQTITFIDDKSVRALFPDEFIFGVRFRMFPSAISPPEQLKSQNLLVVKGNSVIELSSPEILWDWFRRNLPPLKPREDAKSENAQK